MKRHDIVPALVGLLLLALGAAGAVYFIKTKPKAQRQRPMSSMIPVVETVAMAPSRQSLTVECLGTVIADKTAAIQAEVSGRIVAIAPDLVEGRRVSKGDRLVEIESTDYELAVARAEAALLTAQSNLRIEEGQQDAVRRELELMGEGSDDEYRDLVLRDPQLKAATAAVENARLAVDDAGLDLARTTIRAPFDAVIVSTDADVGDYAQPGKVLLDLAATDRYFVRASVPLSALEALPNLGRHPYPAHIAPTHGTMREGYTHKLLPDLTEKGRMVRLLVAVDNPYDNAHDRPLLLNEYVRITIEGRSADDVVSIPRAHLRDGNVVWTIDRDTRLRILPVQVLQGHSDNVLIRIPGVSGFELVTSDLSAAVDGMQLRKQGASGPVGPGRSDETERTEGDRS